jgi:hypothetical protein
VETQNYVCDVHISGGGSNLTSSRFDLMTALRLAGLLELLIGGVPQATLLLFSRLFAMHRKKFYHCLWINSCCVQPKQGDTANKPYHVTVVVDLNLYQSIHLRNFLDFSSCYLWYRFSNHSTKPPGDIDCGHLARPWSLLPWLSMRTKLSADLVQSINI